MATLSIGVITSQDAIQAVRQRQASLAICLVHEKQPHLDYLRLFREYFGNAEALSRVALSAPAERDFDRPRRPSYGCRHLLPVHGEKECRPHRHIPFATLAIGENKDGSSLLPVHGEKVPAAG